MDKSTNHRFDLTVETLYWLHYARDTVREWTMNLTDWKLVQISAKCCYADQNRWSIGYGQESYLFTCTQVGVGLRKLLQATIKIEITGKGFTQPSHRFKWVIVSSESLLRQAIYSIVLCFVFTSVLLDMKVVCNSALKISEICGKFVRILFWLERVLSQNKDSRGLIMGIWRKQ